MLRLLPLGLILCYASLVMSAEPTYGEVAISNDLARVVVSGQRGSIARFELLDLHPVELPAHLPQDPAAIGGPGKNGKPALAVLGPATEPASQAATARAQNQHNWLVNDRAGSAVYGLTAKDAAPWTVVEQAANRVVMGYSNGRGLDYALTYTMDAARPTVQVQLTVTNRGSADATLNPSLVPFKGIHQDYHTGEIGFVEMAEHRGGEAGSLSAHTVTPGFQFSSAGGADYLALKSRFFAAFFTPGRLVVEDPTQPTPVMVPEAAPVTGASGTDLSSGVGASPVAAVAGPVAGWRAVGACFQNTAMQAHQGVLQVDWNAVTIKPGLRLVQEWTLTATGLRPVDLARLTVPEQRIEFTSAFYKFFQSITKIFTWVLDKLAAVVVNYGVAVILLTLMIKGLMLRLTFKQHESMLKMQKLAPELKALQNQYKDNKQQMAQKQMELWKKHGVNPLGGCLPMLVQIPVFIALYQAFQFSADMRGASFLWVHDLTLPDQVWGVPLSFLGGWVLSLNPLPLIYIAATAWMSFSMPTPVGGDPQQEQMAKMMRWLPIIFGVIFYNMPAGLVLYFTANAIISTIEVKWVRMKLGVK